MMKRKIGAGYLEATPSAWTSRSATLWVLLNLVDLAESLVARSIGCGELNPFIPLTSPALALGYKLCLSVGVLILLDSTKKQHLLKYLNLTMFAVLVWNALAILISR